VRIISGTHKGRRIFPDKKFKARPTTDFAKENLFNVLSNEYYYENLDVLDLFAGTGGISYEFASRGVKSILSVEKSYNHFAFIKKTVAELGFKQMKVVKSDVFRFAGKCDKQFDIVFADPPYALENILEIPNLVFSNNLLKENGLLIVEHSDQTDFSDHPMFDEKRSYGSVNFSFFRKE
jgi:16S rRNA (guanine(966)-N(2))-methyltransferase RsmD